MTSLFKQTKKSTSSNLSPTEIKRRKKFAKSLGFPSGLIATERPGSSMILCHLIMSDLAARKKHSIALAWISII